MAAEPTTTPAVTRPLALKLIGYTFPLIALVLVITLCAIGWLNYRSQYEALSARADLLARTTAEALAIPVWNLDRPLYQAQLRTLDSDRAFVSARLVDESGQELARHGTPRQDAGDLARVVPITQPGDASHRLGELSLVISTAETRAQAGQQLLIAGVAFLVLLVAFSSTLHLTVSRLVIQPMANLLGAMRRVERKDWATVGWQSNDEVGQVTASFNRMVEHLRSGDEAQRLLAELTVAHQQLNDRNQRLHDANQQILASIHYASRIQSALLPDPSQHQLAELAVWWQPRDVVGGDYYWWQQQGRRGLILLADCTGHGVPGALMTMLVATTLDRLWQDAPHSGPAALLTQLDQRVRTRLGQDRNDGDSDDGLDAALCCYDLDAGTLTFAGAGIGLLVWADGHLQDIRPHRASLGYRRTPTTPLIDHGLPLQAGTRYYLISDGISSQLGGDPRQMYGKPRLHRTLLAAADATLAEQLTALSRDLDNYRGDEAIRDDMTALAFRVI